LNSPFSDKITLRVAGFVGLRRALRRSPVRDFRHWLIFYQASRQSVEIVHIMHGARDVESLLDG
jgi:plasmid stabilization system protein ParE